MPFSLWVPTVLSQTWNIPPKQLLQQFPKACITVIILKQRYGVVWYPPTWTLSGPMSKTPTIRAMNERMVLKLRRPILQEPSTSNTMSACALVLQVTSVRVKHDRVSRIKRVRTHSSSFSTAEHIKWRAWWIVISSVFVREEEVIKERKLDNISAFFSGTKKAHSLESRDSILFPSGIKMIFFLCCMLSCVFILEAWISLSLFLSFSLSPRSKCYCHTTYQRHPFLQCLAERHFLLQLSKQLCDDQEVTWSVPPKKDLQVRTGKM